MAPWADVLYATDFIWWEHQKGVPAFRGLKLCQDDKIAHRPQWGVRRVEVNKAADKLLINFFGMIGWGGNSGFGALNLAVQFGAKRIILVGFDMRLDRGLHWHGAHPGGLHNPNDRNVMRWRRVVDEAAPTLAALGVTVLNASPVSALKAYPRVDFATALEAVGRRGGMNDIEVTVGEHPGGNGKRAAVVKDQAGNRAWSGEGSTDSEAATEAVRKFLGDRRSAEYLKKG